MRVVLTGYNDRLMVETPAGARFIVGIQEVNKHLGIEGIADRLVIDAELPVKVGQAYVGAGGTRRCKIMVGADHEDYTEPTPWLGPDEQGDPQEPDEGWGFVLE
jgi:hypothetical protein